MGSGENDAKIYHVDGKSIGNLKILNDFDIFDPLVITHIAVQNHHFSWENPLQMAILDSYFDTTRG